ncbi:MAG: hypothetical protein L3J31_05610 [Bacteroidales bacterium]|nr:hypothetical protein [Bacteroidales bacterium]MCF6342266.1 hypothetical protein [Bacteroidales bacterium]
MLIIADERIPRQAKENLAHFGELLLFNTSGITYPAISGHPDIFFCCTPAGLVVAPNSPETVRRRLQELKIDFLKGDFPVGKKYPGTARFNAIVTENLLIHNLQHSDPAIFRACSSLQAVHVSQAYTRCNLIALGNHRFITSDNGIAKVLVENGFEVLYINPAGILLPGFAHGFIGGCCGIWEKQLIFTGNLSHFPEGDKIREFAGNYKIIELYDGPLVDGGSLVFVE